MYFIYMYEVRILKPVEIILSRGDGVKENDGGAKKKKLHS
jgi:hypothetical protein